MNEPENPDGYYTKTVTEERDGKRGEAKYKCWTERVDRVYKFHEKFISFDPERTDK